MHNVRYQKIKRDGWLLRVTPDVAESGFIALCCCEDKHARSEFEKIASSKNAHLFRFRFQDRSFYHKEFISKGFLKQLRKVSRPISQIRVSLFMKRVGIRCPSVFCSGRKGLRVFCVYEDLAVEKDAYRFYQQIQRGEESRISTGNFFFELGRFAGFMHKKGVVHGDFQFSNILAGFDDGQLQFALIDNDRTVRRPVWLYGYAVRNLHQIWHAMSPLPVEFRDRFLNGYLEEIPWLAGCRNRLRRRLDKKLTRRLDKKGTGNDGGNG